MKSPVNSLCSILTSSVLVFSLVSCATTTPEAPSIAGVPSRFVQTPEILALERQAGQDPAVRKVLGQMPSTKLKLLPQGDVLRVFIAQQRDGKWFNITNKLSPADLAQIEAAMDRVSAASGKWKIIVLGPSGVPVLP